MKNLFITIAFLLLPFFAFGQVGADYNFSFKVKFEQNIPVEEIEIYHYEATFYNVFNKINYRINIKNNEIELFGCNRFVVGGSYFPIIVFSNKRKEIDEQTNEKTEVQYLFYLITEMQSYYDDFYRELEFSIKYPNIIVSFKNIEGKYIYNVEKTAVVFFPFKTSIGNKITKINPINETENETHCHFER